MGRLVARDDDLNGMGPDATPWAHPLKQLIEQPCAPEWIPLNKSLLRAATAGATWAADRLDAAGLIEGGHRRACDMLASAPHRAYACPARDACRRQYGVPAALLRCAAEAGPPCFTGSAAFSPILPEHFYRQLTLLLSGRFCPEVVSAASPNLPSVMALTTSA